MFWLEQMNWKRRLKKERKTEVGKRGEEKEREREEKNRKRKMK